MSDTTTIHTPLELLREWQQVALGAGDDADIAVLSTCNTAGEPSARCISVKAVNGDHLVFTTRDGTRKARDLAENPRCALTFWYPTLGRQVRVACTVEPIGGDELDQLFDGRPLAHRIATIVSPQGSANANMESVREKAQALETSSQDIDRPEAFIGFHALPHTIEFWEQRPDRLHDRFEYRRDGDSWTQRQLAP